MWRCQLLSRLKILKNGYSAPSLSEHLVMDAEDLLKAYLAAICKGHAIVLLTERVTADTLKTLSWII